MKLSLSIEKMYECRAKRPRREIETLDSSSFGLLFHLLGREGQENKLRPCCQTTNKIIKLKRLRTTRISATRE